MSSDVLPLGHEEVLRGLWSSAADGRLPHGLLFEGPAGIGKFLAATCLARGLLCAGGPGEPCGTCGPCKRMLSDNHPDFLRIDVVHDAGEEEITVGWVRARPDEPKPKPQTVERFLSLKAAEGGWRVVVLREAERLNTSAQNALLKTLEEPTAGTLLILETAHPARLLDTVRSRLVRITLGPPRLEDARGILAERGIEADVAEQVVRWAGGAPGRALQLAERGACEQRRILLDVLHGHTPALVAAASVWEVDGEFPGKTPRAQARERARTVLDLGLELLADVRRAQAGCDVDGLRQGDAYEPGLAGTSFQRVLDLWLDARSDVDANLAPEGVLDRAFLGLAEAGALRGSAPGSTVETR